MINIPDKSPIVRLSDPLKTYIVKATFIMLDGTQVHIVDRWQAIDVRECYERLWANRDENNIGALIAAVHEETLNIGL